VRQRVKQAITGLADDPYPSGSKALDLSDHEHDVWQLKIDKWRVVYVITEADNIIDVLAVRKRPPYDYGDLKKLLVDIP